MALKSFMGIGEKTQYDGMESDSKSVSSIPRTVAPATSIDATTIITGKIRCKETLRIDGVLKGEVHCERTVIIGEQAKVDADIEADSVIVFGEVKGNVSAKRKITLEQTARMTGDLATPGIVIEEGAKLKGRIVIGAEEVPAVKKTATSRSSSRDAVAAPPSAAAEGPAPPQA